MSKEGLVRGATGGGQAWSQAPPRMAAVGHNRILVADEDPVTARFLRSLLEREGYEVIVAADGTRALELARMGKPSLIISDLTMPYCDGYGLIRELRQDEELAQTPVVILSMRDREQDIVRGFEEGADDYLTKPFHARELLVRIRKLIERGTGRG